ncbi:MAG: hypothetical protein GX495_09250 [Chloroflexi bacterium]|jgi:hypothetical protein|nr:hypothetical protein [Chloroflexota bacterium]
MKKLPVASLALIGILCVILGVALLALTVQQGNAQPADARYFQSEAAPENAVLPSTGAEPGSDPGISPDNSIDADVIR